MAIDGKIRDEKLQYDIKREAAKVSALTSGKIYKYEYLTGEEILPLDQGRTELIDRTSYVCIFSIRKDFWKTNKKNGRPRKKTNRCYYKSKRKTRGFNQ